MDESPKKQPSGAQNRKAKRKRDRDATKGAKVSQAKEWAKRYKQIGPPPTDTAQRVEWANRIAAEVIYEQLVAPAIRAPSDRKLVLEGIRTLGMTAVKALYESRLKRIESTLYRGKEFADALDGLELDPTAGPARPI